MVEADSNRSGDCGGDVCGDDMVDRCSSLSNITGVTRDNPGVTRLDIDFQKTTDEQWFLLLSDVHYDNAHCDRDLFARHLDEAQSRNAAICFVGDTHCAMQGKYDKRSDRSAMREEYQRGPYLDTLVDELVGFLKPYAKNIVHFSPGNHESSIKNHHETDLTERTVGALRSLGSPVMKGGYTGWLYNKVTVNQTRRHRSAWWYTHGYGGGGPVTKDMIQRARQMAYVEGADLMMSGHTHDRWSDDNVSVYLDSQGRVQRRVCEYLKLGTYKDEYVVGQGGWATERGMPPKPLGSFWARMRFSDRHGGVVVDTSKTS